MSSVLILFFLFSFPTIHPEYPCKGHFFLKFRCSTKGAVLLHLSRSALYPAISKCIVCWFYFPYFWFPTIQTECFYKSNFFLKFRCSTKGALLFYLSWSNLYVAITKYIVCSFNFFLFWFPTIYPKCFYKSHLFLKFQVLSERIKDIASFVERPIYISLKIYSVLILVLFILFCHVWTKLNV